MARIEAPPDGLNARVIVTNLANGWKAGFEARIHVAGVAPAVRTQLSELDGHDARRL